MKCKSCGREIESNSMFCNWCGEKQIKERKKKDEIKVPSPRKLASGNYRIYLDAEKQSITETTKDKCIAKAKAIRAGFIEQKKLAPKLTVKEAIQKMMDGKSEIISPATYRGYDIVLRHGFQQYMDIDIAIDSTNPDMAKEKTNFDLYFPVIANKEDFEEIDYFWIIKQAKNVMESSLVMFGSNSATGLIQENDEPEKSTRENNEPTEVTHSETKQFINVNFY